MNGKPPLISVVIPVYNPGCEVLKNTLHSVVYQTYQNLEIWVIDDGSDTDISPIIKEIVDARIHYHKLPHENANVARNFGITKSTGQFIAFLDADDLWLENHIEDCWHTLKETSADGLYGSLILRNPVDYSEKTVFVRDTKKDETMIDYLLSSGYGAQTSTLFVHSESAKDIRWNPKLKRHQDYDFVVRYSKKYKLIPKSTPTVIYRLGNKVPNIDFASCIRFIKENEDDISPAIYNRYCLNMLSLAKRKNEAAEIIRHYQKEATRYMEYLSYAQFLSIRHPRTKMELTKLKSEYLFHILKTVTTL
ncbi:MAG: glycosyltransferase family 2 protein [Prevotellaceae bacterium]|jgi:glycosyltransferase involved in cell wall biosynthesis|nr:glycosyltransferase family 2 protein [Prevotellaceae bacterium]